jgi:DNA invertase Pin-like site-specific DNA recombinase
VGEASAPPRRGWELVETIEDAGYSAKDFKRPAVQEALRALEAGESKALVVAKLDRLSRSMRDFAALMATAQKQHWALVASTAPSTRRRPPGRRWRTCSPPSGSSSDD